MDPIKVGIIGLGGVGSKVKQAFEAHPSVQVVALCDQNSSLLDNDIHSGKRIAVYTDYRRLLRQEEVDLLYLAVPPKHHHAIALDILRSHKHLLCEKPLANSLDEAEEMLESAVEAGIVHAMNFPTYYRAANQQLNKLLQEDRLGELRRIEIKVHFPQWPRQWQRNPWISTREQGGFVREVVPHFLQLIHRHFGPLHEVVSRLEYPADPDACETGVTALMRLGGGYHRQVQVLLDGLSQAGIQEEASITIYGRRGRAKLSDWSNLLFGLEGQELVEIPLEPKDHLFELVDQVVRAIHGKEHNIVSFHEGVQVQRTLEALLNRL